VTNFGPLDWAIVVVYLTGTAAIGFYAKRYIRNMDDYVVAGRALRPRLAAASLVGSELGLVTVMYSAQKGFTGGLAALHIGVIAGVVTLVIGLTGFIVVPLRALRVKTVPEFYELRFSRGVRILGGLILALSGILNMGLFLKAGGIFVAELTGLNDPLQLKLIMTSMIVLVLVYTILGGMVSVVITDFVQFIVLSIGLMLACLLAVRQIGWSTLIGVISEVHGPAGFDPLAEGAGFGPTYVMWMIITAGIVSSAVWQTAVVRASAAESVEAVRRLYTWSSIGMMVRFMLPQFLGVCALAYLWNQTGLHSEFFTAEGGLVAGDQSLRALPVFLGQLLPTGLIGLIGAGMLAAFMSTHDSYLLCWGSVLSEDVVHAATGCRLSVKQRLLLARSFILLIAAFLLVWSLWYPLGQDMWDYMAITGAIYFTSALVLLVAGLYWKRASTLGAYLALGCGLVNLAGLAPIREALSIPTTIGGMALSTAHIGLFSVTAAIGALVAGSFARPDPSRGAPA